MAELYGKLKGNGQVVTRMGTKSSGMDSSINGWNDGVSVVAWIDDDGLFRAIISKTNGSLGSRRSYKTEEICQIVKGKIVYPDSRLTLMKRTIEVSENDMSGM